MTEIIGVNLTFNCFYRKWGEAVCVFWVTYRNYTEIKKKENGRKPQHGRNSLFIVIVQLANGPSDDNGEWNTCGKKQSKFPPTLISMKNQRHCTNSIIDTIKELCDKSPAMTHLQCIFNEENPRLVYSHNNNLPIVQKRTWSNCSPH